MSSSNGTIVKHITTCRLKNKDGMPCGQQFADHPMNVQIIGKPDAHIQKFMGALQGHIQKKHPDVWQQIQGSWFSFLGFLIMNSFDSQDPNLLASVQQFAAYMRFIVRVNMDDEVLQAITEHLAKQHEATGKAPVFQALQQLRDTLTGVDQIKDLLPAEKPLVSL